MSSDASQFKPSNAVGTPWLVGGGILLAAAFLWAYWPTLASMVNQWVNVPDYSHGFFVAPVSLLFLWMRRATFPRASIRPSIAGEALLLLACALRIAAGWLYLRPLDGWTIPLWIAGSVWLLCGRRCLLWSLPAIVFLWFMVPIPFSMEQFLSIPLQRLATKFSTVTLVMLGQPAIAEGNTIWIGDYPLLIAEICSGLRIFVGIFALAFAFVLFSRWSWWQKGLVLVAALPIAVIANTARVVVTGLLYQLVSSDASRLFSHDLCGIAMIPFAAALFWLFLIYLDRLFPQVESLSTFEVTADDR